MTERLRSRGLAVSILRGSPGAEPARGIEVDVGGEIPVAFSGLRRILAALDSAVPGASVARRETRAPEWNVLFPDAPLPGRDLFELADGPDQRRLLGESDHAFRVQNLASHAILDGIRAARRPLVLRNVGACDLVSLRGIVHAVQCSRLAEPQERVLLCDWQTSSRRALRTFSRARAEHLDRAQMLMQAAVEPGGERTSGSWSTDETSLEGRYLRRVVDTSGSLEYRLAAALLAIRACFSSTNHEGALLAATTGLELLDRAGGAISESALVAAWDELADPRSALPTIELARASLGDGHHLRALLLLHLGVNSALSGQLAEAFDAFGQALASEPAPEVAADLRFYRALATTRMFGTLDAARAEIDLGLEALAGRARDVAATPSAWLRNLKALTYFQETRIDDAEREAELALGDVDGMHDSSAAHVTRTVVANFSVFYETRGDLSTATTIWQAFAGLGATRAPESEEKVYLRRLGALQRKAGLIAAAIASYQGAFEKAEATGDVRSAEAIAGAIARVHLDRRAPGDLECAIAWYRVAAARAGACGDFVRLAKDLAGAAIATRSRDFSGARDALARDTAHGVEAASLSRALMSNDPRKVLRELPRGRSRPSRPYTLAAL